MFVSLVIPVLNASNNVEAMWARLREVTTAIPDAEFEAVFVDDGSTDDTAERIGGLIRSHNLRWLLVRLSRNFEHQVAITVGMQ